MNINENTETTRDSSQAVKQDLPIIPQDFVPQNYDMQFSNSDDDMALKVEELVKDDLATIRSMTSQGLITREQGQTLMKQVIKNAYTSITEQHEQSPDPNLPEKVDEIDAFAEFAQANPDFFTRAGRDEVLKYLKENSVNLDKDELLQISKLIENIENSAVDRYLKKLEYGKILNDENLIAKQRLRANAQNSNAADTQKVFTRAQIGKMSGDEFLKNEAAIMEQLRKGLIR